MRTLFLYLLILFLPFSSIAKEKKFVNSIGQEFVYILPGTFMMGSPLTEPGREKCEVQHKVTLTQGFYMQTTEVTREQWYAVMKTKPWVMDADNIPGKNYPVTFVSYKEAKLFIKKLNEKEKTKGYRLPTEAEWEYACRAGTTTMFSFGDDIKKFNTYGWCEDNVFYKEKRQCQKVKLKKPNPWGLYDMHGNLQEMCEDLVNNYVSGIEITNVYKNYVVDPVSKEGESIIVRGGAWLTSPLFCRSASRSVKGIDTYNKNEGTGFRVVFQKKIKERVE